MAERYNKNFTKGLFTRLENESIPAGSASDSSNWMSLGDHIELRRGQALLGSDTPGVGKISGLAVGDRFDGVQVPFRSFLRKIQYYDTVTEDWIEVSTADILPELASAEDVSFDQYHSLAGAFMYASSKNSGMYKIPIANPGSIVDLSSTSHRGKIRIKQNRTFLWDRKDTAGGFDTTGLYGSYIDKDELSDYTAITAETGFTGAVNSVNTTYTVTLAFKSGQPKRTCMYVSVYATTGAGTETFRDSRNGTLLSNFGGTGTINYATGAVSVTFANAPTSGSVAADYYWEDSSSTGIADFSKSTPRTAGQGFTFRQDDGGADFQNIFSLGGDEYCMHTRKTYRLTLSSDDTDATNLIYRTNVGLPYWRAGVETGDGIFYADAPDSSEPYIRILKPNQLGTDVLPESLSDALDLVNYRFDACVVKEWGNYVAVACRTKDSDVNDTLFLYNRLWKLWDKFDYRVSTLEVYNGALIAGDSASKNVFTLFSGLTDEDVEIPNYWISGKDDLGSEGVKYANIFQMNGLIQVDQELQVWLSYDNGAFVLVKTILGDASYVDQGQSIGVGSNTLGLNEVGGGGDGIEASPYNVEFRINTPRFRQIRVKFVATKVGYVSVSQYGFKDIRQKGKNLPTQYIA